MLRKIGIDVNCSRKRKNALLVGLFLSGIGCTEPCIELTTRLCKCEKSEGAQQACTQAKKNEAGERETNAEEQEQCEFYLDEDDCQEDTICDDENAMSCGLSTRNSEGSQ